jgi:hypothetical protein
MVAYTMMAGTEIVVGPAGLAGWGRGWSKPAMAPAATRTTAAR